MFEEDKDRAGSKENRGFEGRRGESRRGIFL